MARIRSRLLQAVPVLLCMTVLVFLAIRLVPGYLAIVLLGSRATPEALAQMRENLGLERPLPAQSGRFLAGILSDRLGD